MKKYFTHLYKNHQKILNTKALISLFLALVITLSSSSQTIMALGGTFDARFYSANNISYYNPNDAGCTSTSGTAIGGNNKDYAGNDILTAAQIQAVTDNMSAYEEAADANDIPWQLIAAVHYRETGLKLIGPSNKGGPYQSGTDHPVTTGPYSADQFLAATNSVAVFIKSLAGDGDLTDQATIKRVLFSYDNLTATDTRKQSYTDQAIALGFDATQATDGEGSPYVMNRADAKRDPTVAPTKDNKTWAEQATNGMIYPATGLYGTYVVYSSLAGRSVSQDSTECASGELVTGGMSLDEAKAFMKSYLEDPNALDYRAGAGLGEGPACFETELGDCTVFSNYFINKYSNARSAGGHGIDVVSNLLAANPSIKGGADPAPYAVFSKPISPTSEYAYAGHTGIILGVNANQGTVIIGQASCGGGFAGIEAVEMSISEFTQFGPVQYAYLGNDLKENP